MGWGIGDITRAVANPVGYIGERIGGQQGRQVANLTTGGVGNLMDAGANQVTGHNPHAQPPPPPVGHGIPTPAEASIARQTDIAAGQARWRQQMQDPAVQELIARRKDFSQGLNAEELRAQREQTARNINSTGQTAMRSLYSNQARSGVRGGMAGAQAARVARQMASDRTAAEQKNTLDNAAIKRQGLDSYQSLLMGQKFGELQQGLGEAGLGVADRTGYQQALIGQAMAAAAGQQPKRGFLGELLGDLF